MQADDDPARLSGQLASFETLEIERSFAQKAYASAFSSLEKARIEAGGSNATSRSIQHRPFRNIPPIRAG